MKIMEPDYDLFVLIIEHMGIQHNGHKMTHKHLLDFSTGKKSLTDITSVC